MSTTYLIVFGEGWMKGIAAEMLTLRKYNKVEISKLSIDELAPKRFCEKFGYVVKLSCASKPKLSRKIRFVEVWVEGCWPGKLKFIPAWIELISGPYFLSLEEYPWISFSTAATTCGWRSRFWCCNHEWLAIDFTVELFGDGGLCNMWAESEQEKFNHQQEYV